MGLRKLKEYRKAPQMRILKYEAEEKTKFPPWMIVVLMIALIGGISFFVNQSENADDETLEEFVEKAKDTKTAERLKFKLSKTTPKQVADIKQAANVDTKDFVWVIDNYLVKHIKKHKEIQLADFKRLYRTLNDYDSLKFAAKQKQGIIKLELYKTYERLNILIIEIRKKELYIATMYKRKVK